MRIPVKPRWPESPLPLPLHLPTHPLIFLCLRPTKKGGKNKQASSEDLSSTDVALWEPLLPPLHSLTIEAGVPLLELLLLLGLATLVLARPRPQNTVGTPTTLLSSQKRH